MNKILNLSIYPTSRCDTGCSHCMDDCNMKNPRDFTLEMANQIINEVKKEDAELVILFTGFGEPLLAPNLVDIVESFGSYQKTKFMGIITSGFLDEDNFRRSQLESLLNGPYAEKLSVSQSFNLFQPSFPKRLKNIIETMINIGRIKELTVRICLAADNYKETWKATQKAIGDISKQMGLEHRISFFGFTEADRKNNFFWIQEFIEDTRGFYSWAVEFESYLIPQWHFIVEKGTDDFLLAIRIQPIVLEKVGRAKKLSNMPVIDFSCGVIGGYFKEDDFSALTIFPDGSVCSECCHNIPYGKIGEDSLFEMDRRKNIFAKKLLGSILFDKRMFEWGTREVCRICQNLVAERGVELK